MNDVFAEDQGMVDCFELNSGVSAFPAACCGVSERIRLCFYLENRDSLRLAAGIFNFAPQGG